MPGTPGPRHTGGAPHASDRLRQSDGDTPYDDASSLPMASRSVGATAYIQLDLVPTRSI